MIRTEWAATIRGSSARRSREVRSRLEGLRSPRRLPGAAAGDDRGRSRLLAAALQDLGPVFASFGLYMATRIDLISGEMSEELSRIADCGRPAPRNYISDLMRREFGGDSDRLFTRWEGTPFDSRLVFERHRATIEYETAAEIRLVRPEVREHLDDLDLLPLAADAFGARSAIEPAIRDFREMFLRRLDMRQEARAFAAMRTGSDEREGFALSPVIWSACSSNILTLECAAGTPIEEDGEIGNAEGRNEHLARLLCHAWLSQALTGEAFPAEIRRKDLAVLTARQLAFSGSSICVPAEPSRESLWSYLIAVAAQDLDGALDALLTHVIPATRPRDDHKLRQRFRQIVPFRDGTWGCATSHLAAYIFVHWRTLHEEGCVLETDTVAFFRGLFCVADTALRLCPRHDALSDALREVRIVSGVAEFAKLMDQRHFGEQFAGMAGALLMMPRRVDSMLSMGTGDVPVRVQAPGGDGSRRRNGAQTGVASLVILFAAILLVARRFLPDFLPAGAADQVMAVIFVVFGALLLGAVNRI